jgi:hypothetical protein
MWWMTFIDQIMNGIYWSKKHKISNRWPGTSAWAKMDFQVFCLFTFHCISLETQSMKCRLSYIMLSCYVTWDGALFWEKKYRVSLPAWYLGLQRQFVVWSVGAFSLQFDTLEVCLSMHEWHFGMNVLPWTLCGTSVSPCIRQDNVIVLSKPHRRKGKSKESAMCAGATWRTNSKEKRLMMAAIYMTHAGWGCDVCVHCLCNVTKSKHTLDMFELWICLNSHLSVLAP